MSGTTDLAYYWANNNTSSAFVDFSDSSSTPMATFYSSGTYDLQVVVINDMGLSVSSDVVVTVNEVLTTITITSSNPPITAGETTPFTAEADDQFGYVITSPSLTWSVRGDSSDGGDNAVSGSGLATAGTTSGSFTLTAASGTVSGTSALLIKATALTPTLSNQSVSVTENQNATINLFTGASNLELNGSGMPNFVGIIEQPAHGIVTISSSGIATYSPDNAYSGDDIFQTEVINKDGESAVGTITLTVHSAAGCACIRNSGRSRRC